MHGREKLNATQYNSRVPKTCFGYASFSLYNKYYTFHKCEIYCDRLFWITKIKVNINII